MAHLLVSRTLAKSVDLNFGRSCQQYKVPSIRSELYFLDEISSDIKMVPEAEIASFPDGYRVRIGAYIGKQRAIKREADAAIVLIGQLIVYIFYRLKNSRPLFVNDNYFARFKKHSHELIIK